MNVLLINPAVNVTALYGRFRHLAGALPPLGLAYIAAVSERAGHVVKILDANVLLLSDQQVVAAVREFSPDLIGITATTPSYYRARDLATAIKQSAAAIPIVLGGPHVMDMEAAVLQDPCFDYVVSGEGEITMLQLVTTLETGGEVNALQGIAFRQHAEMVVMPPQPLMPNLDELPFPARHLLPDLALYKPKAVSYKRLPTTQLFTSRGCPYQCIFCRTAFGKETRFHSPEYVIAEIEHLVKDYGIRGLIINDDTFTLKPERVLAICDLMNQRGLDLRWSCNIRANLVTKPLLQRMKDAGCWQVAVGMESGNAEILKALRKGITLEQGIQACHWAFEVGLVVRPSFILGNPLETPATIEETIRLAQALPVHYPSFTLMTPFPGTDLWNHATQYGTFDASDLATLSVSSNASFIPNGLTAEFLLRKQKEAYRRVYLRPGMVMRHLRQVQGVEDLAKMWGGLKDLFAS